MSRNRISWRNKGGAARSSSFPSKTSRRQEQALVRQQLNVEELSQIEYTDQKEKEQCPQWLFI